MPRLQGPQLNAPHPLSDTDIPYSARLRFLEAFLRCKCKPFKGQELCRLWSGYRDRKGYGQFRMERRPHWAHRISYALFVGPIPDGMTVNHRCRNPSCVNPRHLELLTNAENAALSNAHRKSLPCNIPI